MEKEKLKDKLEKIIPENVMKKMLKFDISLEEYFHITKEKERNILINLIKYLKDTNKNIEHIFTEKEIRENILLKEIDYLIYKDFFFGSDILKIVNDKKIKIEEYLEKVKKNKEIDIEEQLKEVYFDLKNMLDEGKYEYIKFHSLMEKGIKLAERLHWKYLPIYNEQTMENRGCLPEENIEEYYNHYHTIEDLYEEIIGKGIKFNSLNGDKNLNKEIDFKIYTVRWNSYDTYRITRTIYGWIVNNISIPSETLKDGNGGLFDNLEHDSVFYPKKGVAFAMEKTWELADNGQLSLEELKERLQEIAIWISDVERNMRVKQPKWCNYY